MGQDNKDTNSPHPGEEAVRKEGYGDFLRFESPSEPLVPLTAVPDAQFVFGELLGEPYPVQDRRLVEMGKVGLALYSRYLEWLRTSFQNAPGHERKKHYGEHAQIYGNVRFNRILPSRYEISFAATNLLDTEDPMLFRTRLTLDTEIADFNRLPTAGFNNSGWVDDWLFGKKDEHYELIGNVEDLNKQHPENLESALKHQGWSEMGTLRTADLERSSGRILTEQHE